MTLGEAEALVKEGRPLFGDPFWIEALDFMKVIPDFDAVRQICGALISEADSFSIPVDSDEMDPESAKEYLRSFYGESYYELTKFLKKDRSLFYLDECIEWVARLKDLEEMLEED